MGPWDLVLVVVVSLQATVVAYVATPRMKSLFLTLPFPFTVVVLAIGLPLDAANILSMLLLLVPPLAAIEAWALFGEQLGPVQLIGFALALGGVLLGRSQGRAKAREAAAELVEPA